MTLSTIRHIEDLSQMQIELLTKLLVLPPSRQVPTPDWLQEQADSLQRFPPSLLKPTGLVPRLSLSLRSTAEKAYLCETHMVLDPRLIRELFLKVSDESTINLERLANSQMLPKNVDGLVQRLRTLHCFWISPDPHPLASKPTLRAKDFKGIPSGCEACILAAVGGNGDILSDLRATILGRKKKRGTLPRLLVVVDAWIEWTGQGAILTDKSNTLAREVRKCRRALQSERREERASTDRGNGKDESESAWLLENGKVTERRYGEHGPNDLPLLNLRSTSYNSQPVPLTDGQTTSFEVRAVSASVESDSRNDPDWHSSMMPRRAYTESLYSRASTSPTSVLQEPDVPSGNATSEQRAQEYIRAIMTDEVLDARTMREITTGYHENQKNG